MLEKLSFFGRSLLRKHSFKIKNACKGVLALMSEINNLAGENIINDQIKFIWTLHSQLV